MPMKDGKQRYETGYWDAVDEYLQNCYLLQHNDDYLEFLVKQVCSQLKPSRRLFGCCHHRVPRSPISRLRGRPHGGAHWW